MRGIVVITRQAQRYISIISLPMAVLFLIFPNNICSILFGANFSPSGNSLRFLGISMVFASLSTVYLSQLLAIGRPDLFTKLTVFSFAVNLGLFLMFVPSTIFGIPMFGLSYVGAAIANMIASVFAFTIAFNSVRSLTGTKLHKGISAQIISSFITCLVLLVLSILFPLVGLLSMFIYAAVTIMSFLGILVLMHEFDRSDLYYFLDVINLRKMRNYITDEVRGEKRE